MIYALFGVKCWPQNIGRVNGLTNIMSECPQKRLDNDSSWCCCSVNSCTLKCPWKMRQRWQQLVRSAVRQTSNKGHAGHSEIYIKLQHCLQCQTRVDKNAYESAKPEGIPMENCWICPNELVLQYMKILWVTLCQKILSCSMWGYFSLLSGACLSSFPLLDKRSKYEIRHRDMFRK